MYNTLHATHHSTPVGSIGIPALYTSYSGYLSLKTSLSSTMIVHTACQFLAMTQL